MLSICNIYTYYFKNVGHMLSICLAYVSTDKLFNIGILSVYSTYSMAHRGNTHDSAHLNQTVTVNAKKLAIQDQKAIKPDQVEGMIGPNLIMILIVNPRLPRK